MTLQKLILKPPDRSDECEEGKEGIWASGASELEGRAMRLVVKLHDEMSKTNPDPTTTQHILADLDVLVSDYRREALQE